MSTKRRISLRGVLAATLVGLIAIAAVACGSDPTPTPTTRPVGSTPQPTATATPTPLSGSIEIDGSSTVFPITAAVAEDFHNKYNKVQVNVAVSGTGGGFKRFTEGGTDISDASRPIKGKEADAAAANSIAYYEMKVGTDGLSVVVHADNDFVDCLTIQELNKIWAPGSTINNWNQVRSSFPDQKLRLYGPDTDSGTFDYFTEEINGEAQASRSDYTASADDNVLVQGIAGDKSSLGYFGYAYYLENQDKLKALGVDSGNGCVVPSPATIGSGDYTPLSRPLFIYVNKKSLERPEVEAFIQYYMEVGEALTTEVGYVPESASVYAANLTKAGLR